MRRRPAPRAARDPARPPRAGARRRGPDDGCRTCLGSGRPAPSSATRRLTQTTTGRSREAVSLAHVLDTAGPGRNASTSAPGYITDTGTPSGTAVRTTRAMNALHITGNARRRARRAPHQRVRTGRDRQPVLEPVRRGQIRRPGAREPRSGERERVRGTEQHHLAPAARAAPRGHAGRRRGSARGSVRAGGAPRTPAAASNASAPSHAGPRRRRARAGTAGPAPRASAGCLRPEADSRS